MPSTATDRLFGLTTSVAVKAPCKAVATANITLSGLQTINSVSVIEGDRVLVTAQSSGVDNGIYLASTGTWQRAADFDGARDVVQGTQIPVVRNGSQTALFEVATANPIYPGSTSIAFTLRYSANLQYDVTLGEIAATAIVVNGNYPAGCVDRYKTNASPGTTDMAEAFNTAIAVANQGGCIVTWGATAPYRCNSPINATSTRGVIFRDESSKKAGSGAPSVIIAHTGHGFDLSGANEWAFFDVVGTNLAGVVPKSLWFVARNAAAGDAGVGRFFNCRTPSNCTFSQIYYGYASELNAWISCLFYNTQPGSLILNINATNTSGYSSSFITIATLNQSNAGHTLIDCALFNQGNSGLQNEACIQLERANNFSWNKGLWYTPNGLANIVIVGTLGVINFSLKDIRGEPNGAVNVQHGIAVRTSAAVGADQHAQWTLDNVAFASNSTGYLIDCNSTSDIANLEVGVSYAQPGRLLNAHSLTGSFVKHGTLIVTGQAGGTVSGCAFIGNRTNITFSGTDTLNCGIDQSTGRTWETGDTYSAASTACTGAITAAVVWTLKKSNSRVTVSLPSINATATAASSFTVGLALPAAYRPAENMRFPIIVRDNGTTPNQPGFLTINASTGVMTVNKDIVGSGNFTAAAGAGLPDVTTVTWPI